MVFHFRNYEVGDGDCKRGKFRQNDNRLLLVDCNLSAIVSSSVGIPLCKTTAELTLAANRIRLSPDPLFQISHVYPKAHFPLETEIALANQRK